MRFIRYVFGLEDLAETAFAEGLAFDLVLFTEFFKSLGHDDFSLESILN